MVIFHFEEEGTGTEQVQTERSEVCTAKCSFLDRDQYPFQPIKFVNLIVPSPCETEPYNKILY